MRAYLKIDPERIGTVVHVYTTDFFQKRLTVEFNEGDFIVDADVKEFEVLVDETLDKEDTPL
jgi:hypothetical protein